MRTLNRIRENDHDDARSYEKLFNLRRICRISLNGFSLKLKNSSASPYTNKHQVISGKTSFIFEHHRFYVHEDDVDNC